MLYYPGGTWRHTPLRTLSRKPRAIEPRSSHPPHDIDMVDFSRSSSSGSTPLEDDVLSEVSASGPQNQELASASASAEDLFLDNEAPDEPASGNSVIMNSRAYQVEMHAASMRQNVIVAVSASSFILEGCCSSINVDCRWIRGVARLRCKSFSATLRSLEVRGVDRFSNSAVLRIKSELERTPIEKVGSPLSYCFY